MYIDANYRILGVKQNTHTNQIMKIKTINTSKKKSILIFMFNINGLLPFNANLSNETLLYNNLKSSLIMFKLLMK